MEIYKAKVLEEVRERYAPFEIYFEKGEVIEVIKGLSRFDTPAWIVVNHKHKDFIFHTSTVKLLRE